MDITWFGHAAFLFKTKDGIRLLIDPYESGAFGGAIGYGKIDEEADVVITSHAHADHNYTRDIKGSYTLINRAGEFEFKSSRVKTIPVYHDESRGKERGNNLISSIEADGLKVVHLGDLGHQLSRDIVQSLGEVHVLLLPVGGFFTIDARAAAQVMAAIGPRITIPMHYRTDKCSLPISGVEDFLRGKENVLRSGSSTLTVELATLPLEKQIVVLAHAK
jgi:L-ascorbate metabolism protein UlaG (beta-lactamase superfamily)